MKLRKPAFIGFCVFASLTVLFFAVALYIFLHTYYYSSDKDVKTWKDPRWRVFDFNSRQATENEIYNVAEVPAIKCVQEVAPRLLRFEFTPPIKASSWEVRSSKNGDVLSSGRYPEIQFPDTSYSDTFTLIPKDVDLVRNISLTIHFGTTESNYEHELSWPDNYWKSYASVPFSTKEPYSLDEWVGLRDDDPEIMEARRIMGDHIDMDAPTLERSEQVFRFIMDKIKGSGGWPSDKVQAASPLETYKMFISGEGKGWCENNALVYYLFANAAGIKTRLVDIAGKFGPLKLTGHYFCESWLPEEAAWFYVDPQSRIANIKNARGRHISTLELKRLNDLGAFNGCTVRRYDPKTGELITQTTEETNMSSAYFLDDMVLAYKFGYGNNKSLSKIKNFINYSTLLYAPFPIPKLHRVKYLCLNGLWVSFILSILFGVRAIISRKKA